MNELTTKNSLVSHNKIDSIGAILSLLCMVHCLAMPLLIVILPTIGLSFLLNETAEKAFTLFTISLAAISLSVGYKKHKQLWVFAMYLVGAGLLFFVFFMQPCCPGSTHLPTAHVAAAPPATQHCAESCEPCSSHAITDTHHVQAQSLPVQSNTRNLVLLVAGALFLSASHISNRFLCNKKLCCHSNCHLDDKIVN